MSDRRMIEQSAAPGTIWWVLWVLVFSVVLICGLLVGLSDRRQRRAITDAEDVGAFVTTQQVTSRWSREPALDYLLRGSQRVLRVRLSRAGTPRRDIVKLLQSMQAFPELRIVRFAFTPIIDDDLKELKSYSKLEALDLEQTRVTDAGLAHVAHLPRLNWLVLDRTALTDQGLEQVAKLSELQMLSIENTAVTDTGLKLLKWLPHLDRIYLRGTQITEKGIRDFQDALPKVRIIR